MWMKQKDEPIRVAQIMGKLWAGGVEMVVFNYYRAIDKSKIQFDFYYDADSTVEPPQDLIDMGARFYKIPPYQKLPQYIRELKKHLKENQYLIVHSHLNTLRVFPLFVAWMCRVPVRVAHNHSVPSGKELKRDALKYFLRIFGRVFPTDYFACSEKAGRWMFGNRNYDAGKVVVIKNATDFERFRADEETIEKLKKQLGLNDKFVIGHGKIDWMITLVPLAIVIALCVLFFFAPEQSNAVLSQIRFFFGDTFGTYYLVIGLGIFIFSLYIAGSKYGNIVLGEQNEKPKYSFFAWGSMMFTCGLAADILFYSFSEWVLYATDPHLAEMGSIQDWAGVYPLFHWSFIPWGFYLVLAVAFGFMLHVRKRNRQKYSEACRPILGKYTDGWAGRIIDLLAVFALLAGTATTFSVATPLMATIISELFHVAVSRTVINIIILLITCAVYTYSLLHGFKGISKLANICIYMFFGLIAFVLLFGGETRYIIETGFSSLGRMIQNFVDLSTFTDPLRTSNFPQNWTIYYWAYWMVWCVAAPFFIGSISRGRTVRQTILGGYIFGVGSTLTSFIVLGNYSMGMQVTGKADFIAQYLEHGDLYGMIVSIIKTMPGAPVIMVVVLLTMIAFYATSFDSIALTASCYSYHTLEDGEQPNKGIQLMWCILLILLPIALLFAESSMNNLQSVSIVAAFPIGAVIVMIAVSFMKDAKKYMESLEDKE